VTDSIDDVLGFWFGELDESGRVGEAQRRRWFEKDPELDREIRRRFEDRHRAIGQGECEDWLDSARGALAYVIVLDQFSRNMFRGTPAMFSSDSQALAAATSAIERGLDRQLEPELRAFLYMPFMHAEDRRAQRRCVELFSQLRDEEGERFSGNVRFAELHRDIVERFGRFPHRNPILGRTMTSVEQQFLDEGGPSF